MCPACLASTALLVGSVFSAGGLTAIFAKVAMAHKAAQSNGGPSTNSFPYHPNQTQNQNKEKK